MSRSPCLVAATCRRIVCVGSTMSSTRASASETPFAHSAKRLRTRPSMRWIISPKAVVSVSPPYSLASAFSRPAPMLLSAPAWAARSPMTSSGVRLFARRNCATSLTIAPPRWKSTGMICRPSPNTSRAIVCREPGDCPPMSALCPIEAQKAMISPSWKTAGPPPYRWGADSLSGRGPFARKQSPSCISAGE